MLVLSWWRRMVQFRGENFEIVSFKIPIFPILKPIGGLKHWEVRIEKRAYAAAS